MLAFKDCEAGHGDLHLEVTDYPTLFSSLAHHLGTLFVEYMKRMCHEGASTSRWPVAHFAGLAEISLRVC